MKRLGPLSFALAIAALVFAADKIALLPGFRKCCTNAPSANVYRLSLDSDFRQEVLINKARSQNKKVFMNFGSSRSLAYYTAPTPELIKQSTDITDAEKKELENWEIINAAAPGASIVTEYVRLMQWLDHGVRPDFVALEFSPFSVSGRSTWLNEEVKNGIPVDFAMRYALEMPKSHTSTVIGSRIFALSRYRIAEPTLLSASLWESFFQNFAEKQDQQKEYVETNVPVRAGSENPAALMIYRHMVNEMKGLFVGYRVDPDMAKYARSAVKRLKKEKIPLLLWNPAAHPMWLEAEKGTDVRGEFMRLVDELSADGAVYVNLNGRVNCPLFADPVHMHARCFPEVAVRQIQAVQAGRR